MSAILMQSQANPLPLQTPSRSAEEVIAWAVRTYGKDLALCTSFQKGGMVILHMAAQIAPDIRVFTLDTGRLPEETYEIIETVRERFGLRIETVSPEANEVEALVTTHGPNLFRKDVASRMLCCKVRKVRPLGRKLRGFRAYMTGLRRGQNTARAGVQQVEANGGLVKVNPLVEWSREEIERYIQRHDIPVHPLYSKGFTSIGCVSCTRATKPGESERAGRWWWEEDAEKECGLHFSPDGKAERKVDVMLRELLGEQDEDFDIGFDPGI